MGLLEMGNRVRAKRVLGRNYVPHAGEERTLMRGGQAGSGQMVSEHF